MSDTPILDPEAPIDAEFEPADPKPKKRSQWRTPGWPVIFGLAGMTGLSLILSAGAMGLIPGLSGQRVAALQKQVTAQTDQMNTADIERSELSSQVETLSTVSQQIRTSDRRFGDRLTEQDARLTAFEDRLSALETQAAALQDAHDTLTTSVDGSGDPVVAAVNPLILNRLDTLEAALGSFETPPEEVDTEPAPELLTEINALRAELEDLKQALETADTAAAEDSQDTTDAALAVSAIEAAARRGRPFLAAYQKLLTALPSDPAIEALAPLAVSGAPTMADLRVRFAPLRRQALDSDAKESGSGTGWLRSVFGDGVKVRREGEVNAVDVLDDAEAALAENDLARAIRAVESLSEGVQIVFTDWLDSARQRESLETSLEALRLTMIAKDRP